MSKLTVEFNGKMNEVLDALAKEKNLTKVDVLRRAVALYDYAEKEAGQGGKLSITRDGKTVKDIVLP